MRTAARRDPAAGRQKIAEIAQDPASADALIQFAQRVNWEDPDLAVMALDAARALLPKIEPKTRRATNLQMLVRAYRMVDGEVDPGLLKEGFILASDLREEQQGQAAGFGIGVSGGPFPQGGMVPYADFCGARPTTWRRCWSPSMPAITSPAPSPTSGRSRMQS